MTTLTPNPAPNSRRGVHDPGFGSCERYGHQTWQPFLWWARVSGGAGTIVGDERVVRDLMRWDYHYQPGETHDGDDRAKANAL